MAKVVSLADRRSNAVKEVLGDGPKTEAIEFTWYDTKFVTLDRVPVKVTHHVQVLLDEHTSGLQKTEALFYAVKMIFEPEYRETFDKVIEKHNVTQEELLDLFAFIYESITAAPLDSSEPVVSSSTTDSNSSEEDLF